MNLWYGKYFTHAVHVKYHAHRDESMTFFKSEKAALKEARFEAMQPNTSSVQVFVIQSTDLTCKTLYTLRESRKLVKVTE